MRNFGQRKIQVRNHLHFRWVWDKLSKGKKIYAVHSSFIASVWGHLILCLCYFPETRSWDEGVIGMQLGEIAKIHCSPDYAYGAGGFPAWGIMPNSELVFEIEVLSFK